MLEPGSPIFVQFPDRGLRRAVVVDSTDASVTAELSDSIRPAPGSAVYLYWHLDPRFNRKFVRAAATVKTFLRAEPRPLIQFLVTDETEPSEDRQSFRVSVTCSDLTADFGEESACPMLDVSNDGLSVISAAIFQVGDVVQTTFDQEGETYTGKVCVRSVTELDDGGYRYGCEVIESEQELRKGLRQISTSAQRDQLRRIAGV